MSGEDRARLGELISRTRRKARLSPKQLCDETGLDVSTIVHAEFGDRVEPADLQVLCRALGIPSFLLEVSA